MGTRRGALLDPLWVVAALGLLQWLLVLYTLPASFAGIAFVPSAVALSVAVTRTATSSRATGP